MKESVNLILLLDSRVIGSHMSEWMSSNLFEDLQVVFLGIASLYYFPTIQSDHNYKRYVSSSHVFKHEGDMAEAMKGKNLFEAILEASSNPFSLRNALHTYHL